MTAMTAVWIASLAGALLFFVAGFFSGRARSVPEVARAEVLAETAPTVVLESDQRRKWQDEAARLRAAAQEASAEAARRRGDADQARAELARRRAEAERLDEALASERKAGAAMRAELSKLRAELPTLRAELSKLRAADARSSAERDQGRQQLAAEAKRENDGLRRQIDGLSQERDELRERIAVLERRLDDASSATGELDELRQRLAVAERDADAAGKLGAAEARCQELQLELEVAKNRAAELEQLREENLALKSAASEHAAQKKQIAELSSEIASLRAQGLARGRRPSVPPLPRDRAARGTEGSLQSLLNGVHSVPGMRAAVLGDELGLPIVGLGEHSSQLAAFGGFMDGIATKMREFLPMDGLRRIHVEDDNGAAVSAFPLAAGESRLVLVTLTVDGLPATAQMTSILRSAASMVQ